MKLSYGQKEVLRLMKQGEVLTHTRFIGYSSASFNISGFVNKNTVSSLNKKKLIEFDKKTSNSTYSYKLTELGKTIQL